MELRERTPEQKLERYQAMLFVAIANEMRLKKALEALIGHDIAADARDGLPHCVELNEAMETLASLEPIPGMGKR